jgi:dipeptidyl aminopeptidase/acylaminoacyl peptidase
MPAIPVEHCVGRTELIEPQLSSDSCHLGLVRNVPGEPAQLVVHDLAQRTERVVALGAAPRPGRGMGGGGWCWNGDEIIAIGIDGAIWSDRHGLLVGPGERPIWSVACSAEGHQLVWVVDQAEVWMLDRGNGEIRRLDGGDADFVIDPVVMPCGSGVVWMAWDVPDMPWDRSRVVGVGVEGDALDTFTPQGCVQQPRFMPDGRGVYVCDDGGWLNVWLGDSSIVAEPFEHAGPTWGAAQRSFAVSPDGRYVAFARNEAGFGRLCVADVTNGEVRDVGRGVHGQLCWRGARLSALRSGAVTPTQVVVYDTDTWERTVVASSSGDWPTDAPREPEAVTFHSEDGVRLPARWYRATAPRRGLLCWVHGGPTDQWQVTFMPRIAFWQSRGWHVLVVDHRGSTGHGRAFQQALRGRWGQLDAADCTAAIRWAHEHGLGSPADTVVIGGSAGGFTALTVAADSPELVAAIVASYPVCDLVDLGQRSHRFERHYNDTLVGPPGDPLLRSRSPLARAAELARRPMLLLHGSDDPVVPADQSERLAVAVRRGGGWVERHVFEGEGHGFRRREYQIAEYELIEQFLDRAVPPAPVP